MIVGKKKDKEIKKITNETVTMFEKVLKQYGLVRQIILSKDNKQAINILEQDFIVDDLESEITIKVQDFIIKQQPMATDLRIMLGTYSVIADLERIGDYACNFAKHIVKYEEISADYSVDIINIISEIENQLIKTKAAYSKFDHEEAKSISLLDEKIDKDTSILAKKIIKNLKNDDTDNDSNEINLLILSKALERAGDHVVNICEEICYISKGKRYDLNAVRDR